MDNGSTRDRSAQASISSFAPTVARMAQDMKFIGILEIILGAVASLTIIGAVVGIPAIVSGLRLRESASLFTAAVQAGDVGVLQSALEQQARFFKLQKVIRVAAIALILLYVMFVIGTMIITTMGHDM